MTSWPGVKASMRVDATAPREINGPSDALGSVLNTCSRHRENWEALYTRNLRVARAKLILCNEIALRGAGLFEVVAREREEKKRVYKARLLFISKRIRWIFRGVSLYLSALEFCRDCAIYSYSGLLCFLGMNDELRFAARYEAPFRVHGSLEKWCTSFVWYWTSKCELSGVVVGEVKLVKWPVLCLET